MAQTYDLIIRNADIINHAGRGKGDIGIVNGKFAAFGDLAQASAAEIFDASGLLAMPGVIDTQVHFREPGLEWKEDLETGSQAAVMGGVVAVFEMPNTNPTTTSHDAFHDKLKRARHRMHCDHAFYVGGTHENIHHLGDLERLPGCCGVKVFMGASTGTLLIADDAGVAAVLGAVRRRATFHSEDEYRLAERRPLAREGDWTSHDFVRDPQSAIQSTQRLVRLAREAGKRIHVLHVTTREEIEFLREHKDVATVELTPQHLTLEAPEAYERLKGLAQMNPPIRDRYHVEGLWRGITGGVADRARVERVLRVVLAVHEHEGVAVLVRIRDRATRQFGFLEVVLGAHRHVELLPARYAVHDEAELDVAAAALRRAAFDVADLPDLAVVLDDVAFLDFCCAHEDFRVVYSMPRHSLSRGRRRCTHYRRSPQTTPIRLAPHATPCIAALRQRSFGKVRNHVSRSLGRQVENVPRGDG